MQETGFELSIDLSAIIVKDQQKSVSKELDETLTTVSERCIGGLLARS